MVRTPSEKTAHTRAAFWFNRDQCTQCGLCQQFCPSKSINPWDQVPLFEETCEHCHFCELICASGAISFSGKLRIDPQNPFTKALMVDLIDYQELRRFRPTVDFSEVGSVVPSQKMLKQHPYLLIDEDVGVSKP